MDRINSYRIKSLYQGLRVVNILGEEHSPLTLTELAGRLGTNRNHVFRILRTLEEVRFVNREPSDRRYRLGIQLLCLGEVVRKQLDLVRAASPHLKALRDETKETAYLSVRDGDEAVCVAREESLQVLAITARVGRRWPLYAGATAKLFLAFLGADEQETYLKRVRLQAFTKQTITSPRRLREVLRKIQAQGYSTSDGDLDPGVAAVAFPIRDHTHQVVGAIGLAWPISREDPTKVYRYHELVSEAARVITAELSLADIVQPVAQK